MTVVPLPVDVVSTAAEEPSVAVDTAPSGVPETVEAGQKTVVCVTTPLIVTVFVEATAPPVGISTEYTVEVTA